MTFLLRRCDERRRLPVLSETGAEEWADAALEAKGTARCASESEIEEALDDDDVERLVIDPGASADPAALLRSARAATDLGVDLYLRVDARWPSSLSALPDLAWAGVYAGERGDWAARLLAARPESAA